MRSNLKTFFAAVAGVLVFAAGSAAVSSCSSLPIEAAALKPRDARSAYAEAEVLFIGVINTADILAAKGVLNDAQIRDLMPAFVSISEALDEGFKLLKAGETVAALARIDFARLDLARIADALSRANEAATIFLPSPAPAGWHPVTI